MAKDVKKEIQEVLDGLGIKCDGNVESAVAKSLNRSDIAEAILKIHNDLQNESESNHEK